MKLWIDYVNSFKKSIMIFKGDNKNPLSKRGWVRAPHISSSTSLISFRWFKFHAKLLGHNNGWNKFLAFIICFDIIYLFSNMLLQYWGIFSGLINNFVWEFVVDILMCLYHKLVSFKLIRFKRLETSSRSYLAL